MILEAPAVTQALVSKLLGGDRVLGILGARAVNKVGDLGELKAAANYQQRDYSNIFCNDKELLTIQSVLPC